MLPSVCLGWLMEFSDDDALLFEFRIHRLDFFAARTANAGILLALRDKFLSVNLAEFLHLTTACTVATLLRYSRRQFEFAQAAGYRLINSRWRVVLFPQRENLQETDGTDVFDTAFPHVELLFTYPTDRVVCNVCLCVFSDGLSVFVLPLFPVCEIRAAISAEK